MKRVQCDYSLKLKDYFTGVSCGGNCLTSIAMLNSSEKTDTLMVKRMPKSDLKAPKKDGKKILIWASENGLDASPMVLPLTTKYKC
jgi:hypothetical protein